jgi:mannose-6-phosphate isomerase-like protein (cupin superfamily)
MRKQKKVEQKPWGTSEVLEKRALYKLKEIVVNPGERFSYQSHHQRTEILTIVSGEGIITLEGQGLDVFPGRSFFIPKEAKHRVQCNGKKPLVLIELQVGNNLNEKDIVRYDDDYGRK